MPVLASPVIQREACDPTPVLNVPVMLSEVKSPTPTFSLPMIEYDESTPMPTFDEHSASFHEVIVLNVHLDRVTHDSGANRIDISVDLSVISGLTHRIVVPNHSSPYE